MHAARPASTRSSRAFIVALAFALWIAGTLGVMHRSLHVPGLAKAAAAAQATSPGGVHKHADHGLGSLFGEHTDAECRLYDQLEHGSTAPSVPLVVLPILLPTATFAYLQGEAIARWVALFDARGPPSTR
ncbi:hypothetical protein [Variovorax sp. EL159]|uniref:hypothetical protein n=1 Tax=Variovorax sp. EL159 TaxID=1566270 RepID=UPI0008885CA3|nr:hypothetical protein [Variovorax sp. EL159]SCX60130.1 hypothetical protein SAMN03159363_2136 [Variovorax sp. EL159]